MDEEEARQSGYRGDEEFGFYLFREAHLTNRILQRTGLTAVAYPNRSQTQTHRQHQGLERPVAVSLSQRPH